MSVAPRWKRRADEIAEAIGDELSINGTVSIGNDVSLSVTTISALAKAITDVLNPNAIARAIWTDEGTGTHVATVVAPVAPITMRQWSITLDGVFQLTTSHLWGFANTYQIPAQDYSLGYVTGCLLNGTTTNQYRLPRNIDRIVSINNTSSTPVHVQVRNIAGGFTAMGSDISTSMKLTAQPVSIADTVDVKTATGQSVAITGTVNANVGAITVPISNPNNITVPVVNSGNITVPVSLGGVTVPVRASANGTGQNSGGVNVLVSVNPTHSVTVPVSVGSATVPVSVPSGITVPASVAPNLTVPVAVGGAAVPAYVPNNLTVPASVPVGLTVPVAVGTNTVPVAVGSLTVPVANTNSVVCPVENTNNVTVPVTSGGTIDVNIKTIEVSAKDQFHDAMETALEEAEQVAVHQKTSGVIHFATGTGLSVWEIHKSDGTRAVAQKVSTVHNGVARALVATDHPEYRGANVQYSSVYDLWEVVKYFAPDKTGVGTVTSKGSGYNVTADNGIRHSNVSVKLNGTQQDSATTNHIGRRVAITIAGNYSYWELIDL